MKARPELSIIIPALDEAVALPRLLRQLRAQTQPADVIVADGGSRDHTVRLARAAGAKVVRSPRGRGRQMNAGAAVSPGGMLLFLHADSELPCTRLLQDAVAFLASHLERQPRAAGHFALRFHDRPRGHDRLFAFMEAKTRSNRPGTINGDQGLLIPADYFRELGGFDESLPYLEDQRIAQRIAADRAWILLPGHLRTSARRFAREGTWPRYLLMAMVMSLQGCGFDRELAALPGLYRAQGDTDRVRLAPFARHLRGALFTALRRDPAHARVIGRFVRDNLWQLPFALDVVRGRDADPRWTRFFEQHVLPLMERSAVETAAGLAGASLLLGAAPLVDQLGRR